MATTATPQTGYIAATVPATIVRTSGTTLFQLALAQWGNALSWPSIAALNGLIDPWINGQAEVLIPPITPTGLQAGLYAPTLGGATAGD